MSCETIRSLSLQGICLDIDRIFASVQGEGNPMQGSMTSHRRISIMALMVALPAAAPAVASANSLLSGYGGPGQGSQAILGSALLGGGSGGGGGGSGSNSSSSGSFRSAEPSGGTGSSVTGAVRAGGHAVRRGAAPGASGSRAGGGGATGAGSSVYPASSVEAASGAGSEMLGLSGDDLLYILLALAALALTGAFTKRLARTNGTEPRA